MDIAVLFFDRLKVDDPFGALAVHGINGLFGTIAVGFFAQEYGLFFGGGTSLLITQIIGVLSIALFSFYLTYVIMGLHKITVGIECQRKKKRLELLPYLLELNHIPQTNNF